jgi:hypothetical protein
MRRIHFAHHAQHIAMVFDERLVILQCQRHAHVLRVTGAFDQRLAAPTPDFLLGEFLMHDGPVVFRDVVAGELRMARDAPPGEEHAEILRSHVGGHADQLAQVTDLGLAHFGHGIAEVVVGGNAEDFDAFALGDAQQFVALVLRPVERISVRSLAVNLHAVVAEFLCGANKLRQGESFATIPAAEVSDAVESDFHRVSFQLLEFPPGPENRIVHEGAIRWMAERSVVVTELDEDHF